MSESSSASKQQTAALLALAGQPSHVLSKPAFDVLFAARGQHNNRHISPAAFLQAHQQLAVAVARISDIVGFPGGRGNSECETAFLQAALAQERAEKEMIVNQLAALNQASAFNAQANSFHSAAKLNSDFAAQLRALSQSPLTANPFLFRLNQQSLQQDQQFRALAAGSIAGNIRNNTADLLSSGTNNAAFMLQQASLKQQLMAVQQHAEQVSTSVSDSNKKYKDASLMPDPVPFTKAEKQGRRGPASETFPQKLHRMLADLERRPGGSDVASFLPHGRAFAIHNPKKFVSEIMPGYFRMSRFSSFQRQLNLYDFKRITEGRDKGAYYHELFLHGRVKICSQMKRTKIKGSNSTSVFERGCRDEINFYIMPPVKPSQDAVMQK
jgi:hypothetical protein